MYEDIVDIQQICAQTKFNIFCHLGVLKLFLSNLHVHVYSGSKISIERLLTRNLFLRKTT